MMSDSELSIITERHPEFLELSQLGIVSIERQLGYFREEPFVVFGYCPGGGEVIWRDGHCSGFGAGGWRLFLAQIAPAALCLGVDLGSIEAAGTHVLVVDRRHGIVYGAPRGAAEDFLSEFYELPAATRPCMCSVVNCSACPVRDCPGRAMAGPNAQPGKRTSKTRTGDADE